MATPHITLHMQQHEVTTLLAFFGPLYHYVRPSSCPLSLANQCWQLVTKEMLQASLAVWCPECLPETLAVTPTHHVTCWDLADFLPDWQACCRWPLFWPSCSCQTLCV